MVMYSHFWRMVDFHTITPHNFPKPHCRINSHEGSSTQYPQITSTYSRSREILCNKWPLVVASVLNSFRSRTARSNGAIPRKHQKNEPRVWWGPRFNVENVSRNYPVSASTLRVRRDKVTASKSGGGSRLSGACRAWWISNWRSNGT